MIEVSATDWMLAEPDSTSQRKTFDRDEFLNILLAEIENQNPLEPLENAEFLGQLTQVQMLDATDELSDAIREMLLGDRLGRASDLLGRTVKGFAADGSAVEGVVERVSVNGDTVNLEVGGVSLPLENVKEIVASA
ncbi:MAG: flagellar hook capping protein [Planctomycetes bacterium]|nr:flagellar hook capping protein [Planctomycetota bacterium]